jgi:hypothetical protein
MKLLTIEICKAVCEKLENVFSSCRYKKMLTHELFEVKIKAVIKRSNTTYVGVALTKKQHYFENENSFNGELNKTTNGNYQDLLNSIILLIFK